MTPRTKWLLLGCAAVFGLYLADSQYRSWIEQPTQQFNAQLDSLSGELQQASQDQLVAQKDGKRLLNLLDISFSESDTPSGHVVLTFSGEAAVRLTVECLDVQMSDIGARWKTRRKPGHGSGED